MADALSGAARADADAIAFGGKPPPRGMRLIEFKSVPQGARRGFATVELPNGLTITGCIVCVRGDSAWASFPGAAQIGADGRQIVVNGKAQYTNILNWPDSATRKRWSDLVVELVRAAHPEALS
jgi:hypothetical protein